MTFHWGSMNTFWNKTMGFHCNMSTVLCPEVVVFNGSTALGHRLGLTLTIWLCLRGQIRDWGNLWPYHLFLIPAVTIHCSPCGLRVFRDRLKELRNCKLWNIQFQLPFLIRSVYQNSLIFFRAMITTVMISNSLFILFVAVINNIKLITTGVLSI